MPITLKAEQPQGIVLKKEEAPTPTGGITLPQEQPKRESQHLKQFGAGILDIGAGVPGLAGLIATPFKAGYHMIEDDMGVKDALVKGLDNPAMRVAGEMHEGINDLVGVEEPQGLEQLSRLASMLIPVGTIAKGANVVARGAEAAATGARVATEATQAAVPLASKLTNAARTAAPYVLPFVQTTKGASNLRKSAEVGAQVGITIGADQGLRYALDQPTVFNSTDAINDYVFDSPYKAALGTAAMIAGGFIATKAITQKAAAMEALARSVAANGSIPKNPFSDPLINAPSLTTKFDAYVGNTHVYAADQIAKVTDDPEMRGEVLGQFQVNPGAAAQASVLTGKFPNSSIIVATSDTPAEIMADINRLTPEGVTEFNQLGASINELFNRVTATMSQLDPIKNNTDINPSRGQYREKQIARFTTAANRVRGEIADIEAVIRERGIVNPNEERRIDQLNRRVETLTNRLNFWRSFGDDEFVQGIRTRWRVLDDPETGEKSIFNRNATITEQLEFLRDIGAKRVETGLFVGNRRALDLTPPTGAANAMPATEGQLMLAIARGIRNPDVKRIFEKYSRFTNAMLKYYVENGRISQREADKWAANHTMFGIAAYMHGREAVGPNIGLAARIKYVLGWNTPEADDAARPWLTRVSNRVKQAYASSKDAALQNKKFENSMPSSLNMEAVDWGQGIRNPMAPIKALESMIASMFEHVAQNKARNFALSSLDGKTTIENIANAKYHEGAIAKRYDAIDPETDKRIHGPEAGLLEAIQKRHEGMSKDEIESKMLISTFEDGRKIRWYVPDRAMQHSLTFHPNQVEGIHKVGAYFKNLNQNLTTRNILFAIPQFFMSTHMNMTTARAHGINYNILDPLRGARDALVVGLGNEMAQHLDRLVATNRWFQGQGMKDFVERFKGHMQEVVRKSMMMEAISRSGGASGGSMTIDSITKVAKVSEHWAEAIQMTNHGNVYGTLKGLYRFGAIINRALQDGPTIGLMLKAYRKELSKSEMLNVPQGMVRLYRGETSGLRAGEQANPAPDWVTESPEFQATMNATGRWFTRSIDEAAHYNSVHGADDGHITYIDVPEGEVEQYLSRNQPEARRFSAAGRENEEYFVSPEMAARRQRYTPEKARSDAAVRAGHKTKEIGGDYNAFGSAEWIRHVRAWVPFSGAALHGLRALGYAFKKDPVKTSTWMMITVGAPAIAELAFLHSMATEEQKDSYYKTGDNTRVSNIMIPHPDGKTFVQIPVEPSLRFVRAMFVEGLNGVTGLGDQYRYYNNEIANGQGVAQGEFGHALIAGLQSLINLPLPPPIQAMINLSGNQGVFGLDPNAENYVTGIRPLASQQTTAMGGDITSTPNAPMTNFAEALVNTILGGVGSLAVSTFNAYHAGPEGDTLERLDNAKDEFVSKVGTYSRVGTLFGLDEATKITRASSLDRQLRPMIRGLKQMQAISEAAQQGQMHPGGVMPAGNAPIAPEDTDTVMLAVNASMLAKNPRYQQAVERVNTAFRQISVIKASDRIREENIGMLPWLSGRSGEPWTLADKTRAENDLSRIINQERVMQLFLMKQHEDILGFKFSDYAGKSPPLIFDTDMSESAVEETYAPTPEGQAQPTGSY